MVRIATHPDFQGVGISYFMSSVPFSRISTGRKNVEAAKFSADLLANRRGGKRRAEIIQP